MKGNKKRYFLIACLAAIVALTSSISVVGQTAMTVRGIILAPDGSVQPGCRVIFTTVPATSSVIEYSVAASGTFVVSLMMNIKYNVRIMMPGYPLQYFSRTSADTMSDGPPLIANVFSNNDSVTIRLSLTPKSVSPSYGMLRGRIFDSTGAALVKARVTVIAIGRDVTAEVETDASGQYLCRVPAQSHYLSCTKSPYPTQFWSINGTTPSPSTQGVVSFPSGDTTIIDIRMVMNPGGGPPPLDTTAKIRKISGRVYDQTLMTPISGASIFAMRQDSAMGPPAFDPQTAVSPYSANSDNLGSYAITNLAPGAYYVFARAMGYKALVFPNVELPQQGAAVRVDSGTVSAIDFGMRTAGTVVNKMGSISGKVLSKTNGQPLAGVIVCAFTVDSANIPVINSGSFNPQYLYTPYCDTTKTDGTYSIKNMPRGSYIVFTKANNFPTQYYLNTDSVRLAKRMLVDSMGLSQIDFVLRAGASISGKVVSRQGKPISGVGINANLTMGGMSVFATTDTFGNFTLQGLSAGQYCLNVSGANFSPVNDSNQCKYAVADGGALTGVSLMVDQAGVIMGPYTATVRQDSTGAMNSMGFEIALFSDTLTSKDSMLYESRIVWANIIPVYQATSQSWQFVANQVPLGKWRIVLRGASQKSATVNSSPFVQTRGYSFATAATFAGQPPITISGSDTIKLSTINFPAGYSVFGKVSLEKGERPSGVTVTAFVKDGGLFVPVSRSYPSTDSGFELPGLIDGQDYYLRIDAPNYPSQFWSPTESSVRPMSPWHFSTASFTAANVGAVLSPKGVFVPTPQLWAWFNATDTGGVQVQCNTSSSMPIDSIVLYGKDTAGATVTLASYPYTSTQYSYTWKETRKIQPDASLQYVFVGKGPTLTLRSNVMYYWVPDTGKIPAGVVPMTLTPTRTGVQISWRADSSSAKSNIDTTILLRKADNDSGWNMYKKMWGSQTDLWDGAWDKTNDLGKTVRYQIKVYENGVIVRQSAIDSFTATQAYINQMANVLPVGTGMKYTGIQQAVDAAQDFDIVAVESGLYKENVMLRGKAVTLQGNWTNGKAPVIDGMGGLAISAPYTPKSVDRDAISINGFKIQNSLTGIASSAAMNINQCLFVGIQKEAILLSVDSVAIEAAAKADPFAQAQINQGVWQCTFIGKGTGSAALRANSKTGSGIFDSLSMNKNPNTPGGHIGAGNSIFAYYASTFAPVDAKGAGFAIDLQTCDFWQASKTPISSQVVINPGSPSIDPMFIDTIDYFLSDSSQLKSLASVNGSFGYDVRRGYNGKNQDEPVIPAVTNFKAIIVGPRKVSLSWNALPDSVKIDGYMVFRVLGYDSLFKVNSNSQWEPKKKDSIMFSIMDTFRTRATAFVDTTPAIGIPYLYAVAGISVTGNMGNVYLPFPPPLSAYITKIEPPLPVIVSMSSIVYGFNNIVVQWKKPSQTASAALTYSLVRIAGGPDLTFTGIDSAAVRTLLRQRLSSAAPPEVIATRDTVWSDLNATLGASYLYVVSIADSASAFADRPLAWTVTTIDTTRFAACRSMKLLAGQWNMIGPWGVGAIPFTDTSSALFSWDDTKTSDKLFSQYSYANSLRGCGGYWINPGKDLTIGINDSMYSNAFKQRDSISVRLVKGLTGWNQVSSPFPFALSPKWLTDTAFTAYAWAPDSSQYVERSQLFPWEAWWIHTDRDTQLVFRASDAVMPGAVKHMAKHAQQVSWELQLSLKGKSNDPDNFIGVVPASHGKTRVATLKPPQAFDFPQLYLLDNTTGSAGDPHNKDKLSKQYKKAAASPKSKLEWMVGVSASPAPMKMAINGIASLPKNVYLFWVTASSIINLRQQPEIEMPAHKQPAYGYIVATVNPHDLAMYANTVELRRSFPNPLRTSATIEFFVPYAWRSDGSKQQGESRDLSLSLFNVHGQRITTLISGQAAIGEHRIVWNGGTEAGRPVAPGVVIARLSGSDFQKTIKMLKVR